MNVELLQNLLQRVATGSLSVAEASKEVAGMQVSDLGYARVDHHRQMRQGMPEVVYGENKSAEQLIGIVAALLRAGQSVMVTRVGPEKATQVQVAHPALRYAAEARVLTLRRGREHKHFDNPVAIVSAGTSDQSVAEEAAETLMVAGVEVERIYDVGVAGIHRLFAELPRIQAAPAVICIAGMEGALPSVLGGLVSCPIVAVPTSVGYGVTLGGMTALFAMLTGCASGVTVVNIDNGFGAAMAVLRLASWKEDQEMSPTK